MRPVCDFDHICIQEVYTACPLISLSLISYCRRVGFSRERFKKDNIPLVHKSFPIRGKAFMSAPAEADVFFVGIQNVDDRIGGQVADAFAKKPFGAEQRGADVQMRQRKVEAGCFVRDRRREEVVFVGLGDDGLGPVTAYRCPERSPHPPGSGALRQSW